MVIHRNVNEFGSNGIHLLSSGEGCFIRWSTYSTHKYTHTHTHQCVCIFSGFFLYAHQQLKSLNVAWKRMGERGKGWGRPYCDVPIVCPNIPPPISFNIFIICFPFSNSLDLICQITRGHIWLYYPNP